MGFDFLRRQQSLGRRASRRRIRIGLLSAPVVCALFAMCVLVLSRPGDNGGDSVGDAGRMDVGGSDSAGSGEDGSGHQGGSAPVPAETFDHIFGSGPVDVSSTETFLADLEGGFAEDPQPGVRCVTWEQVGDLPSVAEDVMRRYQDLADAVLMTAGYLDIKGNAWGAMVRIRGGGIDVLLVSTVDDEVSAVRVSRMRAGGDVG